MRGAWWLDHDADGGRLSPAVNGDSSFPADSAEDMRATRRRTLLINAAIAPPFTSRLDPIVVSIDRRSGRVILESGLSPPRPADSHPGESQRAPGSGNAALDMFAALASSTVSTETAEAAASVAATDANATRSVAEQQ